MIFTRSPSVDLFQVMTYLYFGYVRFRTSLHYSPRFAFIDGIKECGGYTVVLLLVTTEEKSVGYTVFLHLNEGRKERGYLFLHLNEGRKECGYTVFLRV